jgi:hypothetical protein
MRGLLGCDTGGGSKDLILQLSIKRIEFFGYSSRHWLKIIELSLTCLR